MFRYLCGLIASALLVLVAAPANANEIRIVIDADNPGPKIDRHIFGQFAEHLGTGIYDGVWVGPDSDIPNVRGIRKDVVAALRDLKVPNVRWPGGCYADQYHWRDGNGPASARRARINANWGNVLEPNAFGTHEFMDFVEQIGSEAFIVANVGSGSVQEAADWLEYMTADKPTALAKERIANGREEPWRIKFFGIGNESWSCGGNMSPGNYVQQLKTYTTFLKSYHPEQKSPIKWVRSADDIQRIAVGPEAAHTEYTEAIMKAWGDARPWSWGFEGIDLHHYSMGPMPLQSPATGFGEVDYAAFVSEAHRIGEVIDGHSAIMDRYDPEKKVALVVGEWGAWLAPMEGSNPNFLRQENSLRDGILATIYLNAFIRRADRVRVANIAQMVNVLQSMVQTDGPKMLLTPTYHVFRMYVPFQDATSPPITYDPGEYRHGEAVLPAIDAIAGRTANGTVVLAVTNIDPNRSHRLALDVAGVDVRSATGEVLTARALDAVNTFDNPKSVSPREIRVGSVDGAFSVELSPASVTVLRLAN